MDDAITSEQKQVLISCFLEVTGADVHIATQFLQATSWRLEEALQWFYEGGFRHETTASSPSSMSRLLEEAIQSFDRVGLRNETTMPMPPSIELGDIVPSGWDDDAYVPEPNTVAAPAGERLYDDYGYSNEYYYEPSESSGQSDEGNSGDALGDSGDALSSLYCPPVAMMFNGSFEKAKLEAAEQYKWLLVNLQCTTVFGSHLLNRDTWSNEAVQQTISTFFIFWQAENDTANGMKVCNYYRLKAIPAILVIDPITGRRIREWSGMIEPERLLEELMQFLDRSPQEYHKHLRENTQTPKDNLAEAPENVESSPLPEETIADESFTCRVAIRLPTGKRIHKNFLPTDPIMLLWSFASSQLAEAKTRPYRLLRATPGAWERLDSETSLTFAEAGLSDSLLWLQWD